MADFIPNTKCAPSPLTMSSAGYWANWFDASVCRNRYALGIEVDFSAQSMSSMYIDISFLTGSSRALEIQPSSDVYCDITSSYLLGSYGTLQSGYKRTAIYDVFSAYDAGLWVSSVPITIRMRGDFPPGGGSVSYTISLYSHDPSTISTLGRKILLGSRSSTFTGNPAPNICPNTLFSKVDQSTVYRDGSVSP